MNAQGEQQQACRGRLPACTVLRTGLTSSLWPTNLSMHCCSISPAVFSRCRSWTSSVETLNSGWVVLNGPSHLRHPSLLCCCRASYNYSSPCPGCCCSSLQWRSSRMLQPTYLAAVVLCASSSVAKAFGRGSLLFMVTPLSCWKLIWMLQASSRYMWICF